MGRKERDKIKEERKKINTTIDMIKKWKRKNWDRSKTKDNMHISFFFVALPSVNTRGVNQCFCRK